MLTALITLANQLETLIIDQKIKIADRDIIQEDRVEAGNVIYTSLINFTNAGRNIWETSDVSKYNDYLIYNTESGEAETVLVHVFRDYKKTPIEKLVFFLE